MTAAAQMRRSPRRRGDGRLRASLPTRLRQNPAYSSSRVLGGRAVVRRVIASASARIPAGSCVVSLLLARPSTIVPAARSAAMAHGSVAADDGEWADTEHHVLYA